MSLGMDWIWGSAAMRWLWACAAGGLSAKAWRLRGRIRLEASERWRERRIREELEAYTRLDVGGAVGTGLIRNDKMADSQALARRVCRTIAEKSAFTRVAMLLRTPEGRLVAGASVGMDDLTLAAIHTWGERVLEEERTGRLDQSATGASALPGGRAGYRSFAIPLGEWKDFDRELGSWARSGRRERRRWRRAIVAPIRFGAGRMVGAIAVCADGEKLDGSGLHGEAPWVERGAGLRAGLVRAMGPIETLAERIASAMEKEALAARLLRSEKLAGLGQLAGGVAHALSNPLTAVLGFAELIAETTNEPRVRQDAGTILLEARRMSETVQRLVEFWRPNTAADDAVDLAGLLRQLAAACTNKLREREVRLELAADAEVTIVRGSRDRLRQVFEHLLNNAAQAIAAARPHAGDEEHTIRLTLSQNAGSVHVIVSDTGPGFEEPARVFDPFYTTKGPEQGAGLGLSICYGIVREHGGEISAFNLHPQGAAVVVELPERALGEEESSIVVREHEPKGRD